MLRGLIKDSRFRLLAYSIIFAVLLIGFVIFGVFNEDAPLRPSKSVGIGIQSSDANTNEDVRVGTADVLQIILALNMTPPGGTGRESVVIRAALDDLSFVAYDTDPDNNIDTFCMTSLRIGLYNDPKQLNPDSDQSPFIAGANLLRGVDPLCYPLDEPLVDQDGSRLYTITGFRNGSNSALLDSLYTEFLAPNDAFLYPYDGFETQGVTQVTYQLRDKGEVITDSTITPVTGWYFDTSESRNWNITITSTADVENDSEPSPEDFYDLLVPGAYERMTLSFQRPLLFRLAYPFLLTVILILIWTIPFIGELGSTMEVAAALLFGIFGLKQVVAPATGQGQSLIDIAFLALYVILAFTTVALVFSRILKARRRQVANRKEQTEQSRIEQTSPV